MDSVGDLFVADVYNARVLKYDTPLNPNSAEPGAGDTAADLVIGQSGFSSAAQCKKTRRASASALCEPTGVAVDSTGDVYIAEGNRILEFDNPRLNGPQIARRVYGQKNFTSDTCGPPMLILYASRSSPRWMERGGYSCLIGFATASSCMTLR